MRRARRKPARRLWEASARTSSGARGGHPHLLEVAAVPPQHLRDQARLRDAVVLVGDHGLELEWPARGFAQSPQDRDHPPDHRLGLVADPVAAVEVEVDEVLGDGRAAVQERQGVVAGEDDPIRRPEAGSLAGPRGSRRLARRPRRRARSARASRLPRRSSFPRPAGPMRRAVERRRRQAARPPPRARACARPTNGSGSRRRTDRGPRPRGPCRGPARPGARAAGPVPSS